MPEVGELQAMEVKNKNIKVELCYRNVSDTITRMVIDNNKLVDVVNIKMAGLNLEKHKTWFRKKNVPHNDKLD